MAKDGRIGRSVLGQPGKTGFRFVEDESDPGWMMLHLSRGLPAGESTRLRAGHCLGTPPYLNTSRMKSRGSCLRRIWATPVGPFGNPRAKYMVVDTEMLISQLF